MLPRRKSRIIRSNTVSASDSSGDEEEEWTELGKVKVVNIDIKLLEETQTKQLFDDIADIRRNVVIENQAANRVNLVNLNEQY